ncbi:MAG: hypothetical protein JWM76_2249 [Pseudonocardiales bacterium]|nr:hypothetical protein [Pseudonocardiales bacterium]
MDSTRRALIYCRISQDREGAGLGVDRQREDCIALAKRLGWTVVGIHIDNDVSAYSGKPRPAYRTLLADLDAGRADAVLVWHADRLHRSPRELEGFIDLCDRKKIATQTVQAGQLDLSTPTGRMTARVVGSMARYESEHKSERTRRAQLQAAQAGKWLGGASPLGWTVREDGTAVLDVPAARRIRKATADVLAGVSLGSIVTRWNAQGFTTGAFTHGCVDKDTCADDGGKRRRAADCPDRVAGTWNYTSLRQVLTRARNAGLAEYHGEIVGTSMWPNIVTEEQWRGVLGVLSDPSRRRSQSNRAKHLLAGIAVCGKEGCGTALKSATVSSTPSKGTNRTVYRCPGAGTGHVARSADILDDLIRDLIAARLRLPDLRGLLAGEDDSPVDTAELRSQATALRLRLKEAADSYAHNKVTLTQLEIITTAVNEQIAAIEAQQATVFRFSQLTELANSDDPAKVFLSAPIDRQRAIIRELVTVTVLPGKRGRAFDPDLIRIDWRNSRD